VRYFIDKSGTLIVTVAEGHVGFDDIRSHQDQLLADPNFDLTFDQLIDTTPAVEIDLTEDEARVIAERPIVSPKSRRAFVAVAPHVVGLGLMMGIYHADFGVAKVRVCYSLNEALNWLGRKPV
jgi:hypothetical protein